MFKKMFALASVTALTGLVATVAAVGCSSTTTVAGTDTTDTGVPVKPHTDGGIPTPGDNEDDTMEAGGQAEEKTVGKVCTSSADCKVAGSVNDNACSKGGFQDGDLFGTPVCIQPSCTQGSGGTIADLLCDDQTGLCLPTGGSDTMGICFPFCSYDSTMVSDKCAGGNKCNIAYLGTDTMTMKASAIGFCFGACGTDADCMGTAGQKCQAEDGLCLNADKYVTYAKVAGQGCSRPVGTAAADCNCNFVGDFADGGTSPNPDKGFCTHACVTGAAGNTVCQNAAAGWKCTAKLPTVDDKGAALFSAQPDDVAGTCALPCTDDASCAAIVTSSGLPATQIHCKTYADGKYCDASGS